MGVKHASTRHASVAVIKPLTLLFQDTLITLQLPLKVSSCVCIVKVHLYLLSALTFNSALWLPVASQGGLCGVKSLVFTNIEILNLIMGMCFIICANKGPSHPISNPFLTIISLWHIYFIVWEVYLLNTKQ